MQTVWDVGVDVASKTVVVASATRAFAVRTVANARAPLMAWLRTLPRGSRIGMEATGRYHQLLAELAHAAGMIVYVINARDLKKYAEGVGRRGKTDRVDAEVVARFVAREHDRLHPYAPRSAQHDRLGQLLKRRGKVKSQQVALKQGLQGVAGVKAAVTALIKAYDRLLARIDALITKLASAAPDTQVYVRRVRTIPGYGKLGSVALAHAFEPLAFDNVDAFIAYTGLDPRPDDSGEKRGRRRLSKRGPAELRRTLHMCAMSANRCPAWRPYYRAQRAKGLSATAALVVLARKMARTAYGVCKNGTDFNRCQVTT